MTDTKGAIWTKLIGLLYVDVPIHEGVWRDISEKEREQMALLRGAQTLADEILEAGAVQIDKMKAGYHLEVAVMVDKDSRQELVTRVRDAKTAGRREALLRAADEAETASLTHKAPGAHASASFALGRLAKYLKKMADEGPEARAGRAEVMTRGD